VVKLSSLSFNMRQTLLKMRYFTNTSRLEEKVRRIKIQQMIGVRFHSNFLQEEVQRHGSDGIRLAGREFLAGSECSLCPPSVEMAGEEDLQVFRFNKSEGTRLTSESLPPVLDELVELVETEIHKKGAVLIKGLTDLVDNNSLVSRTLQHFGPSFPYTAGNATRAEIEGAPGVMVASDDPPQVTIEPHLEMSYNREMPRRILFFCHRATKAEDGGETPICDMGKVYQTINKDENLKQLLGNLKEKIRYSRVLPSRKSDNGGLYSWEKTFYTEDKEKVVQTLSDLGYSCQWLEDGSLRYWYEMSAVRKHRESGNMIWCNQASACHGSYYLHLPGEQLYLSEDLAPSHTAHLDGTHISTKQLGEMRRVQWEQSRAVRWEEGDLLVLDNLSVAHGRMGFNPEAQRRLVVGLVK